LGLNCAQCRFLFFTRTIVFHFFRLLDIGKNLKFKIRSGNVPNKKKKCIVLHTTWLFRQGYRKDGCPTCIFFLHKSLKIFLTREQRHLLREKENNFKLLGGKLRLLLLLIQE
jgi:hypothetical protein